MPKDTLVRVIVVGADAGARCAVMALVTKQLSVKGVITAVVPFDNNSQLVNDLIGQSSLDELGGVINEQNIIVSVTEALPIPACVEQVVANADLEKTADRIPGSKAHAVIAPDHIRLEAFIDEVRNVDAYVAVEVGTAVAELILHDLNIKKSDIAQVLMVAKRATLGDANAPVTDEALADKISIQATNLATKFVQQRCKELVPEMDEIMKVNIWVKDPDKSGYKFSTDLHIHGSNYALFKSKQR